MSIPVNPPFVSIENMAAAQLQFLERKGLATPEGRLYFLTQRLTPLVQKITQLQEEITSLTATISTLKDQVAIVSSAKALTEKMGQMETLLPMLKAAGNIHEDLQCLGDLFHKPGSLNPQEKEVIDRIIYLYKATEILFKNQMF
jgi:hypothetical protein